MQATLLRKKVWIEAELAIGDILSTVDSSKLESDLEEKSDFDADLDLESEFEADLDFDVEPYDSYESYDSEYSIEQNRLLTYNVKYIKPAFDEKVLIYILDIEKMVACWLPPLRNTVYMLRIPESEAFKRPRNILLIRVFEFYGNQSGSIEIGKADCENFLKIYKKYQENGGEIYYKRVKKGKRIKHVFELYNPKRYLRKAKRYKMSDLL